MTRNLHEQLPGALARLRETCELGKGTSSTEVFVATEDLAVVLDAVDLVAKALPVLMRVTWHAVGPTVARLADLARVAGERQR